MHLLRGLQKVFKVWTCCLAATAFTIKPSTCLSPRWPFYGGTLLQLLVCNLDEAVLNNVLVSVDDAHGIDCLRRRSDTKLKAYSRPIMLLLS